MVTLLPRSQVRQSAATLHAHWSSLPCDVTVLPAPANQQAAREWGPNTGHLLAKYWSMGRGGILRGGEGEFGLEGGGKLSFPPTLGNPRPNANNLINVEIS